MNIVHIIGYILAAIGLYSIMAVTCSHYCPKKGAPVIEINKMYLILFAMLFGGITVTSLGVWLSLK